MEGEMEMEWEVEGKWREPREEGVRVTIYFRMDNMHLMHYTFLMTTISLNFSSLFSSLFFPYL